jgi:mono/diheme cytochrome c family protein
LFRRHCAQCHGARGTGAAPPAPDFTDPRWQRQRSDEQLVVAILDGKGNRMPPFRGKVSEEGADELATLIRTFDPTYDPAAARRNAVSADEFRTRFRGLEAEMERLKKQFRELSGGSAGGQRSGRPECSPHPAPSKPAAPAAETPAARELFRQHCVKCHGPDGTGSPVRRRQPAIPDFTDPAWQARRSEAQLLASILDGKGGEMPSWRGKVSEEQARGLVARVRAFAPTKERPARKEQDLRKEEEYMEGVLQSGRRSVWPAGTG